MVDQISFRTDDALRWGPGIGRDLLAHEIDVNFWVCLSRLVALEDHQAGAAGIDYITVNGNQMVVHLTNHVALGPFTLPMATWNFRGDWEADQTYAVNDVVLARDRVGRNAAFVVTFPIANSGSVFDEGQNDGNGHDWWAEIIAAPSELPNTGPAGSVLMMSQLDSPSSIAWVSLTRNFALYLETPPNPLEEVFRYIFTEVTTFPANLPQSHAHAGTQCTVEQDFQVYQNGANVGTIEFLPSPYYGTFIWPHDVTFEPGDVMTIVAPSVPDPHMTHIAWTLVGVLP